MFHRAVTHRGKRCRVRPEWRMEWPPRATEARRNEARLEIGAGRCGSLATVGREVWCTDDGGSSCSSIGTWRGAARLLDSLADMVQPACYLLFGLGFELCTASPSEMLSRRSDNRNIAICGHIATQLFNQLCTIFSQEESRRQPGGGLRGESRERSVLQGARRRDAIGTAQDVEQQVQQHGADSGYGDAAVRDGLHPVR